MSSSRRFNLTRLALRVHRWAGLVGAAVFLLVGTSGAVLVFHADLDQALFPEHFEVAAVGSVSHERAVERVRQTLPDATIRGLNPFNAKDPKTIRVRAEPADGGASYVVLVDPYDGAVRTVRRYGPGATKLTDDPMSWLYLFHYTLTAGKLGQLVVVLASMLLLLSALTGGFVYRKQLLRALTFRERLRTKNTDTLLSSLHRLVGAWSLALSVLLSVTGFWMLRGTFSESFWQSSSSPAPSARAAIPSSPHSYDDALAAARRALPGFEPTYVALRFGPTREGQRSVVYGVLGRHADDPWLFGDYGASVTLDGGTLEPLDRKRAADKSLADQLTALAFPLHQGHWGGLPVKLLYVFAGLGVPLLSLTGPLLVLRRQRRRSQ